MRLGDDVASANGVRISGPFRHRTGEKIRQNRAGTSRSTYPAKWRKPRGKDFAGSHAWRLAPQPPVRDHWNSIRMGINPWPSCRGRKAFPSHQRSPGGSCSQKSYSSMAIWCASNRVCNAISTGCLPDRLRKSHAHMPPRLPALYNRAGGPQDRESGCADRHTVESEDVANGPGAGSQTPP